MVRPAVCGTRDQQLHEELKVPEFVPEVAGGESLPIGSLQDLPVRKRFEHGPVRRPRFVQPGQEAVHDTNAPLRRDDEIGPAAGRNDAAGRVH